MKKIEIKEPRLTLRHWYPDEYVFTNEEAFKDIKTEEEFQSALPFLTDAHKFIAEEYNLLDTFICEKE